MAADERTFSELAELAHSGNADKDALLAELGLNGVPTRDQILADLEDRYLTPKDILPAHWLDTYQVQWEDKTDLTTLLHLQPSAPQKMISLSRAGLNGRVIGWTETDARAPPSARNSMALNRAPAPPTSFVRGKAGYIPYMPGGLEDVLGDEQEQKRSQSAASKSGLRSIPPGFERGFQVTSQGDDGDLQDLANAIDLGTSNGETEAMYRPQKLATTRGTELDAPNEVDSFLPTSRGYLTAAPVHRPPRKLNVQKRDWAHVVDIRKPMKRFNELVPNMAHKYPFELDTFQKEAVYHLEMGDSVFVAAHTSAGKTVVAEYAIALAMKHMTRAIYTSPIKALSNQKFRDFKTTFSSSSVGILTGDVQINPEASCLIMTTEILRSMLYKGADLIRDVEFVIFDEVHYVNDAERGVVWEEVIIMLPDHVNIILLSATVPNTREFADWIGRTKKKDIYVISTPQRPVPLEHYLYAGRDIHKIVDKTGAFLNQGYKEAGEAVKRKQDKEREAAGLPPVQRVGARGAARAAPTGRGGPPARGRGGGYGGSNRVIGVDKNLYVHLLGLLKKKDLLPVVVFTFSKRRCEENAATLVNMDLSGAAERSEVHIVIEKALARLKGSDKKLPQIARMRDLLSRGIGVHHGGLLPIVKEVVEILFARGLVKVLFATETFAMGVNMPARCVVFSQIRKHDGRSFRELNPGEYTQMSGRAGRRGLDSTGVVIIVVNEELPETNILSRVMLGTPTRLVSQFRLTYNMILNLLRVEALRVEEMIKRSFSENSTQKLLPDQQKKVLENEDRLRELQRVQCDVCLEDINEFYDASLSVVNKNIDLLGFATRNAQGDKLFSTGRVVVLRDGHFPGNVAVLLNRAQAPALESGIRDTVRWYNVVALASSDVKNNQDDVDPIAIAPRWPPSPQELATQTGEYDFATIAVTGIWMVTNRVIKVDADSIVDRGKVASVREATVQLQEILDEWSTSGTIPEADWSKLRALEIQDVVQARNAAAQSLSQKSCRLCSDFGEHYQTFHGEKVLRAKIAGLKLQLSDQNLELLPEYESRIEVLKQLNFIDNNSTVVLKGRVACEINSGHELVLTELILENTLAEYAPEEVVALLSTFVFQERTDVEPSIPEKLQGGLGAIRQIAERVSRVQLQNRVSEQDFENKINAGLVEVVYEWAKGMPFEQITALTDIAEGTVVRVITRLDETCREVRDAARVIGDAELFKKMEEAQAKIKRDIVFAASLYF